MQRRKLARWHLRLMESYFELIHRAGVNHQAADVLSPLSTNGTVNENIDDEIPVLGIQQTSRKEKLQSPYINEDCDDTTVNCEPHLEMAAKADDVKLQTIAIFVLAQSKDTFYYQMKQLVGTLHCRFTFDKT